MARSGNMKYWVLKFQGSLHYVWIENLLYGGTLWPWGTYCNLLSLILLVTFVACHQPPLSPCIYLLCLHHKLLKKGKICRNTPRLLWILGFSPPPLPSGFMTCKIQRWQICFEKKDAFNRSSFAWTNRSRAIVIRCTKDPKRALTQSDKMLPIAEPSFISNNHTETFGRQTEGKKYQISLL